MAEKHHCNPRSKKSKKGPREIQGVLESIKTQYQDVANKIITFCTEGPGKGRSYTRLEWMCDKFGARFSGTPALEQAIDYVIDEMRKEGSVVRGEEASVMAWKRNEEEAELILPRSYKFALTALGSSVGTPNDGLIADAIVIKTFEELEDRAAEVNGKIVIFNQEWKGYSDTVEYRAFGAARAAVFGAVGTLIRSLTPFSMYTVHTGGQLYDEGVVKIPTACITVEDADMFERMQTKGEQLKVKMLLGCENHPDVPSRNVVAEIVGTDFPTEMVLIGGHIDSWDLAVGAMDDGGGSFISKEVLSVVKDLELPTPKRTLQACLFTAEETNFGGSVAYFNKHEAKAENYSIMMESDSGTFEPTGLSFSGSPMARLIMQEIGNLMSHIGLDYVSDGSDLSTPDLDIWPDNGYTDIPLGSLLNDDSKYFWYHHTHADCTNIQNSAAMDRCTAMWAVYAYVLADLDIMLPREDLTGKKYKTAKIARRC